MALSDTPLVHLSASPSAHAPVLRCRDLQKSFGGVRALDLPGEGPTFEPGRVTALLGSNGAGKTTLFHLLTGQLKPDAGTISLDEKQIDGRLPWQIARLGVGRLFQDVRVFDKLSALDNVLVAFPSQSGENALLSLFARPLVRRQERANKDEARRLLDMVGLGHCAQIRAANLSYGQQKLLALARLLAQGAQVFLLDEPASGVNPQMIAVLQDIIRRLAREGRTVVLVEHNLEVVQALADHIYFLHQGRLIAQGTPLQVLADSEIRAAYLGLL